MIYSLILSKLCHEEDLLTVGWRIRSMTHLFAPGPTDLFG